MAQTVLVGMAKVGVAGQPDLIETLALGSCVGVVLYDPCARIGGIAHAMLPDIADAKNTSRGNPGKFVNTAIELMVKEMSRLGAKKKFLIAKLAGGANMFPAIAANAARPIGERNIEAARKKLAQLGIPIKAEAVGGSAGRTIVLDTCTGRLKIRTAQREGKEI